jgi:hypothetical protein
MKDELDMSPRTRSYIEKTIIALLVIGGMGVAGLNIRTAVNINRFYDIYNPILAANFSSGQVVEAQFSHLFSEGLQRICYYRSYNDAFEDRFRGISNFLAFATIGDLSEYSYLVLQFPLDQQIRRIHRANIVLRLSDDMPNGCFQPDDWICISELPRLPEELARTVRPVDLVDLAPIRIQMCEIQ